MTFTFKGNLCGSLCGTCEEQLSNVTVRDGG